MTIDPKPVTLPYFHSRLSYESPADDEAFQKLLTVWNQVGEALKRQPAGTIARLSATEGLCLIPVNSQLYVASIMDYSWKQTSWSVFRAEDFNGIGAEEFEHIDGQLRAWLAAPEYAEPLVPAEIADHVNASFAGQQAPGYWIWAGNDPTPPAPK